MRILVTGFEPFGDEPINPSWEAVRRLPGVVAGAEVVTLQVPVVFGTSAEVIRDAIVEHDPDVIVSVGQAGGRSAITPERVAVNLDDGSIPDNDGHQPVDEAIHADGPAAYFSTLPVKAMVTAVREAGVPAAVSNSAGTYVCNHVMYQVLHMLDRDFPGKRGGFIHVPYVPQQVVDKPDQPSLSLGDIVVALEAALRAIVEHDEHDERVVGGAIH